jgi:hypothetical protein
MWDMRLCFISRLPTDSSSDINRKMISATGDTELQPHGQYSITQSTTVKDFSRPLRKKLNESANPAKYDSKANRIQNAEPLRSYFPMDNHYKSPPTPRILNPTPVTQSSGNEKDCKIISNLVAVSEAQSQSSITQPAASANRTSAPPPVLPAAQSDAGQTVAKPLNSATNNLSGKVSSSGVGPMNKKPAGTGKSKVESGVVKNASSSPDTGGAGASDNSAKG